MNKALLAALVFSGVCLSGADVRPRPEGERGEGPAGRGGKISAEAEAALVKACKADLDKFCKGLEQSRKKKKCLKENESALSAGCGKALKSLPQGEKGGKKNSADLAKACQSDLDRFCKGSKAGQEQRRCLAKNEQALSAGCGRALKGGPPDREGKSGKTDPGRQKAMGALAKACKADLDKFCREVKAGPEQGGCLMEHENELSDGCAKTLKGMPPPEQAGGPGKDGPGKGGPGAAH